MGSVFGGLTKTGVQGQDGNIHYATAPAQTVADFVSKTIAPTTVQQTADSIPESGSVPAPPQFTSATGAEGFTPKITRPTFQDQTTDKVGNATLGPALTKRGLLLGLLKTGLQGGLDSIANGGLNAAPGQSYFGVGMHAAAEENKKRIFEGLQVQQEQAKNQLTQAQADNLTNTVPVTDPSSGRIFNIPRAAAAGLLKTNIGEAGKNSRKLLGINSAESIAADKAKSDLLKAGFIQDENSPGGVRAATPQEMSALQKSTIDKDASVTGLNDVKTTAVPQQIDINQQNANSRSAAAAAGASTKGTARSDKSYQFSSGQLDKLQTPIDQLSQRLGRLNDTIAQNSPQADALVAPELLTVMAGGQGSGLRMNEAEIARIVGGRSKWEDLKAAANKWSLDPKAANSITPEQRQQIRALVQTVNSKVQNKQQILDQARQGIIDSEDPNLHRQIIGKARSGLSAIDSGSAAPSGGSIKIERDANGRIIGVK